MKAPTFAELVEAKKEAISFITEHGMSDREIAYFDIRFGMSCVELSVPFPPLQEWWERVPETVELPIIIMLYSMKRDNPEAYEGLMNMMGLRASTIDMDRLMGFNA